MQQNLWSRIWMH